MPRGRPAATTSWVTLPAQSVLTMRPLPRGSISACSRARIGDTVWSLGNPFGAIALDGRAASSRGVISGIYRIPAGGGEATLTVHPSDPEPLDLTERGPVESVSVYSVASESLADPEVAERQADAAVETLTEALPWVTVRAGSRIDLGSAVRLYVVAPAFVPSAPEDPNRASLVFLLSYGPYRVLLTGDADAYSEEFVVRRYEQMASSNLVQAPHHGSSTSSSPAFVRWTTEGRDSVLVVVSAGRDNTYGLPDEEIVARWRKARGRVRITAREGAVRIGIRAAGIRVTTWRSARNRYGIHSPTF